MLNRRLADSVLFAAAIIGMCALAYESFRDGSAIRTTLSWLRDGPPAVVDERAAVAQLAHDAMPPRGNAVLSASPADGFLPDTIPDFYVTVTYALWPRRLYFVLTHVPVVDAHDLTRFAPPTDPRWFEEHDVRAIVWLMREPPYFRRTPIEAVR